MRELYVSQFECTSGCPEVLIDTFSGTDPFYDRFPWFRLVGRAFVYLTNLLFNVPLVHKVSIVNEKGEVQGYLRIGVQIVEKDENEKCEVNTRIKQCARLTFREENFSRRQTPKEVTEHSMSALSLQDRVVEGNTGENFSPFDTLPSLTPKKSKEIPEHQAKLLGESSFANKSLLEKVTQMNYEFPEHMKEGEELTFRVSVLQALKVPVEYIDLFCQFNFLHRHDEAFSTEPVKNSGKEALSFYYVQNLIVTVSKAFLHYIHHYPIIFEIFGHFQPTSSVESLLPTKPASERFAPKKPSFMQSIGLISTPIKSSRTSPLPSISHNPVRCKHDLLVHFEICELAPSGEYSSAFVSHSQNAPTDGVFLLHQGIQRRVRVTICHETCSDLKWIDCQELVIGRIRSTPDSMLDDFDALSLGLFQGHYLEMKDDNKVYFQFEAAWDSSLHNSALLNRVTAFGEKVYMTISIYMEIENCSQLAVISKDLTVVLYSRDSRLSAASRSLRSLLAGSFNCPERNKVSGLYELLLKEAVDTDQQPNKDENVQTPVSPTEPKRPIPQQVELTKTERNTVLKVLKLVKLHIPVNKQPPTGGKAETPSSEYCLFSNSVTSSGISSLTTKSGSSLATVESPRKTKSHSSDDLKQLLSPEELDNVKKSLSCNKLSCSGCYIAEVLEKRVGCVVSKKGYMNFLEEKTRGWMKRWVVVRRPYILLFNDERDPVIRGVINLAHTRVEYSEDQLAMLKVPNTFSVCTNHRGFLMQTLSNEEMQDWLYAINPLLAGQIKSRLGKVVDIPDK
ncbi:hypothetical protein M514_01024 [Trichuris suis]|nr:hypothetical protein M514_01024 [Trichuris suis]